MRFPRALRRFMLGYLILHLLTAGFFVFVLTRIVRYQMIRDAQSRMSAMTTMLAEHIDELGDGLTDTTLPDHLKRLGEKTNMRFTLITTGGVVVADSNTGTRDIGPHGTREEILLAKANDIGFAERFSSTIEKPMMYFARAYHANPPAQSTNVADGYVRVAIPALSINSAIGSLQKYVWLFAIFLGSLTGALMAIFSARNMRPLTLFSDAARRIGTGQYENNIPAIDHRNDEWGDLGDAFQHMQTELTRREDRLTENSQRLEAVLSSMIEGVLAIAPSGKVMLANGAACDMFSLSRPELVGRTFLEIVRIPELQTAIETTQSQRTFSETEFNTLTEPARTIRGRVSILANENKAGVAVVLHDVTELRKLETMRQDFVANVSHELKTPLSSIKAYAETLRLGALNDQNKNMQFVEQIEFQAELLNRQIQDLIQLARIETGETTFEIANIDINEICETCHRQFSTIANERGLELKIILDNSSPTTLADARAVETIVKNLVVNAIHYTPNGGTVTISTRTEKNSTILEIIDTGIGIAIDQQARVFERFYRVDKARSRDMGGTGLGLAIVKHLTQAFGGTVELDSQPGKGSKFQVRFPAN